MASNYDIYAPIAIDAANKYGLPPNLFLWQIGQESGWDPNAKSKTSSASGIAQFIDSTAKWLGVDRSDPVDSLYKSAQYNSTLLNSAKCGGDFMCMLDAYGTTKNNPKATAQAQNIISGISDQWNADLNNPNSAYGQSITGQAQGTVDKAASTLAGLISRIPLIIIGLVFLAGAIYLYKS